MFLTKDASQYHLAQEILMRGADVSRRCLRAYFQYEAALSGGMKPQTAVESENLMTAIVNFNMVRVQAVSLWDCSRTQAKTQAMADDNPEFALTFIDKALGRNC